MVELDFSISMVGRTRRRVFWCTFIAIFIVEGIIEYIDSTAGAIASLLSLIFSVPLITRRAQDVGMNNIFKYINVAGWIIFTIWCVFGGVVDEDNMSNDEIAFSIIMFMWLLYFICSMSVDSEEEANKWGPNPKIASQATVESALFGYETRPTEQRVQTATPTAICSVCKGRGLNAAGHVCPVCGGRGVG